MKILQSEEKRLRPRKKTTAIKSTAFKMRKLMPLLFSSNKSQSASGPETILIDDDLDNGDSDENNSNNDRIHTKNQNTDNITTRVSCENVFYSNHIDFDDNINNNRILDDHDDIENLKNLQNFRIKKVTVTKSTKALPSIDNETIVGRFVTIQNDGHEIQPKDWLNFESRIQTPIATSVVDHRISSSPSSMIKQTDLSMTTSSNNSEKIGVKIISTDTSDDWNHIDPLLNVSD